jgi:pyruvate/2-oxoglutarate dehydrogenase complex dihydrolipoamide acyltransferase (E2) component
VEDNRLVEVRFDEYADDMDCEAMVIFWHVAESDPVVEGQELCEIESVKAISVVVSPCSGVLETILCPESAAVEPGQVLATIRPV